MSKFDNVPDHELMAELARRAEEKKKTSIPQPSFNIDWSPLQNYIVYGVQEVAGGENPPKDFEHWIFEMSMEAVYGKDFWKWWNSKR